MFNRGTPAGVAEPYRMGDRVRVWMPTGWVMARVVGVRTKSIDVLFDDGKQEAIGKHRACVVFE